MTGRSSMASSSCGQDRRLLFSLITLASQASSLCFVVISISSQLISFPSCPSTSGLPAGHLVQGLEFLTLTSGSVFSLHSRGLLAGGHPGVQPPLCRERFPRDNSLLIAGARSLAAGALRARREGHWHLTGGKTFPRFLSAG